MFTPNLVPTSLFLFFHTPMDKDNERGFKFDARRVMVLIILINYVNIIYKHGYSYRYVIHNPHSSTPRPKYMHNIGTLGSICNYQSCAGIWLHPCIVKGANMST